MKISRGDAFIRKEILTKKWGWLGILRHPKVRAELDESKIFTFIYPAV